MGLCRKILVIEPYYGGSHKFFLQQLQDNLGLEVVLLTLPARSWKWRMRFAAPWVAEQLKKPLDVDAVLCSTFVDVASLRGLAPSWLASLPVLTYFHENQFAYPVQVEDGRDIHFALTNYLTALASDRLGFNSRYNLDTFLAGCREMEKRAPDMKLVRVGEIVDKATVLPLGVDFQELDRLAEPEEAKEPVIIWNHRWEHDKGPDLFFHSLFDIADEGVPFKLIVLGQAFRQQPAIFTEARERLQDRIIHFGFAEKRSSYLQLLKQGSLVVSTASHEFFGLSVVEAVRAGCRPLLPRRLAYPELFAAQFLYDNDQTFKEELGAMLRQHPGRLSLAERLRLTEPFTWHILRQRYQEWLSF